MDCPYCGNAMQKGSIVGGAFRLHWLWEGERNAFWRYSDKGIRLGEHSWLKVAQTDAFYCEPCGKFIVDVREPRPAYL
jgi:hypothetical protein